MNQYFKRQQLDFKNVRHFKNGRQLRVWIFGAALLGLIGAGFYYQHAQRADTQLKASALYEQLIIALQAQQLPEAQTQAQQLLARYPKTSYAALASFFMAKWAVDQEDWAGAATHLRFVMDHLPQSPMPEIARLRLARVRIAQKQYTEALALLQPADVLPDTYWGLSAELEGDIDRLQGAPEKARAAYAKAAASLPEGAPSTARLQLKRIDVGFEEPTAADPTRTEAEAGTAASAEVALTQEIDP